eukprot:CCRYP_012907-RA/>CCRYP_012907-RA protein AED:0.59 eAED:0.66 QI:0/0/0/1/1/1/2/0/788
MADACFTARATTREHVAASIKKLTLPTTDNGQYGHDAAMTFIAGIHQVLRETYNPGDPGNGMFKLCVAANTMAMIKVTSVATAKSILNDAKAVAAAVSTGSTIAHPAIDSHADTQDIAGRLNLINQAVICAKEGAAGAITAKVGSDVTDAVLKTADGSNFRSINNWLLEEVLAPVVQGADHPNSTDVLSQLLQVIQFELDFRKKVSANMELLCAKAGWMTAYGITVDDSQLALVLLDNIDVATGHDWGSKFRPTLQTIRRKYAYNHAHNAATSPPSLRNLLAPTAYANSTTPQHPPALPTPYPTKSPCSPNSSSNSMECPTPKTPSVPPPYSLKAILPTTDTTTIASVTVDGTTTNATTDVVANAAASGETNAATCAIHPTLARTAKSSRDPSCTQKCRRTVASGTSGTRGIAGSGFVTRWKWLMFPDTNLQLTWEVVPARVMYAADPPHTSPPSIQPQFTLTPTRPPPIPIPSTFKHKAQRKALERQAHRLHLLNDATLLDCHISWTEDEITSHAKADTNSKQRSATDTAHTTYPGKSQLFIAQHGRHTNYALSSTIRGAMHNFSTDRHVCFTSKTQVRHYDPQATTPLITFDSSADGHYLSETDRLTAGLPILGPSSRQVGIANGGTSKARYISCLPFPQLSTNAALADSFDDFPQSLMSVGKTTGVTVHKDTDVLITCRGEPLLIGACDEHGCYRIPLAQHKGHWQPWCSSKKARHALRQANSVYDLPSTKQAIKWMHAVCGYPVKSTWLKAVHASNFIGWPLLTVRNIQKYFPETVETPKGHLN